VAQGEGPEFKPQYCEKKKKKKGLLIPTSPTSIQVHVIPLYFIFFLKRLILFVCFLQNLGYFESQQLCGTVQLWKEWQILEVIFIAMHQLTKPRPVPPAPSQPGAT
jgi:hypothetical protein